jgi:hypothetical protein
MAFIVEMFSGTPDKLEILGFNSDGDLYVKSIVQKEIKNPDFRTYKCSGHQWKNALELGRRLGWSPTGTILEKTIDTANPVISDYDPCSWGDEDYKVFTENDAKAFAAALTKATELMNEFKLLPFGIKAPKIISAELNESEFIQVNGNLSKEFLLSFITFLLKGKFCFVYDD